MTDFITTIEVTEMNMGDHGETLRSPLWFAPTDTLEDVLKYIERFSNVRHIEIHRQRTAKEILSEANKDPF